MSLKSTGMFKKVEVEVDIDVEPKSTIDIIA